MAIRDSRVSDYFRKHFLGNPVVESVGRSYLNREYNLPVQASLTKIYCSQEELDLPKNGGTNNIHFDVPARVYKAFYYFSDTNEDNSAFYFCVGTHKRNTLKRLFFEYRLSVRYALNKWNTDHGGEYKSGEPWVKISEQEMKENDLHETVMAVKANTLLLADVGGFHKRGEFRKPGIRETVEINYRDVETPRNALYPIEKKLLGMLGRSK